MALKSAHGGHVFAGAIKVPNDRWSANWRVRDTEVTTSDSGGSTLYRAILQDNDWEFSAPRDDAAFPEAVGLAPGNIVPLILFKLGAGNKADQVVNTLVTEVAPVVDNKGDVVRVTVRGKGGFCTKNVSV